MISPLIRLFLLSILTITIHSEPVRVEQKDVVVQDYTGPMTKEVLASLKDVESLHIRSSNITNYPSHVFSFLPNLRKIEVEDSTFNIMDYNIYENANKLEEIRFVNNNVPDLPLSLLRHTTFEKIEISKQGQVKTIPENFANETKRLKYFECSSCKIETIEDGAFTGLDKLEHLDLHKNSIKTLSKTMLSPLKNLKKLDLAENQIEKLTADDLVDLHNLRFIDMSKNPLKEFNLLGLAKGTYKLRSVDVRYTQVSQSQIDEHIEKLNIMFIS